MQTNSKKKICLSSHWIYVIVLICICSCKKELKTYYFTEEELDLVMLYGDKDTFAFKDSNDIKYSFYVDTVIRSIGIVDFLGLPQYKTESINIEYFVISKRRIGGAIRASKTEGVFGFLIDIEFPGNYFRVDYKDDDKFNPIMQKMDQLIIDSFTYSNVYVFNNASVITITPTQKVYLSTEYGLLKFEDLETGQCYTLVRDE